MRRPFLISALGSAILICGCDCGPPAGTDDAGAADGGIADAGEVDAGVVDAGEVDAGATDAGSVDAGAMDAGAMDAGAIDAGTNDAGRIDAGPSRFDGGDLFDVMSEIPNLRPPLALTADFNNDRHLDAVAIQPTGVGLGTTLVVALSTGPGTYAVTYDAGFNNANLTFFDVDRDGNLDLVAKDNSQPGWTAFHRGDGQGRFVLQGRWYNASSLLDVTGDGVPESVQIVSASFSPGAVYVSRTIADGGVSSQYTQHTLGTGWGLITDFNNDRLPDYVSVGDYLANTRQLQIFLGQADGGIVGAPSTVTCTNCGSGLVTLGDMNADGRPDVVALTHTAVTVWTASATGVLTLGATAARAGNRVLVAFVTDMDGDGRADIVAQEEGVSASHGVRIYFSRTTGLEASDDYLYTQQGTIRGVTDVDYDGHPDVVMLDNFYAEGRAGIEALRLPARSASQISPDELGWFDMNADGLRDGVSWLPFQDKIAIAHLGPKRRFQVSTQCAVAPRRTNESRFMRDLDGDGFPDQYSFNGMGLEVSLGRGGCNFDPRATWLPPPVVGTWLDANGDRKLDLAHWNGNLQLQLDAGVFAPAVTSGIPSDAVYRATDWSGDGLSDIILLNTGSTQVTFARGDGAGRFAVGTPQNLPPGGAMDFATVDVDADGDRDVLVAAGDNVTQRTRVDLWRQISPATFMLQQAYLSSGCTYWTNLFTADLDLDGAPEVLVSCQNMTQVWTVGATPRLRQQLTFFPTEAVFDADRDGDLDLVNSQGVAMNLTR